MSGRPQLDCFLIGIYLFARLVDLNLVVLTFAFWDARSPMPPPSTLWTWARSWGLDLTLGNPQRVMCSSLT